MAKAEITGFWYHQNSDIHRFLRMPDGAITIFDVSRSTATQGSGIDNRGRIAGFYFDSDFVGHSFTRAPDGSVSKFDPPGSFDTRVERIDGGEDHGAIVGEYADANFTYHG